MQHVQIRVLFNVSKGICISSIGDRNENKFYVSIGIN